MNNLVHQKVRGTFKTGLWTGFVKTKNILKKTKRHGAAAKA
jgi:hypothetical protein